jgi:flagellar hook assembly protein FlgD
LFDLNGNLIWRENYSAGNNGGKAGVNNPAWDGKNRFGEKVPNGVYFYQVTADQKVLGRGKVIVLK